MMEEIWKYSHTTTVGCTKSVNVDLYYSSEGRLKKIYSNGREELSTPKYKGRNGERIYITIAKLFPEICGEWYKGCEVDHINTDRFDNRAINLRCVSSKENMCNELTKQHCSNAAKQRWQDGCYNMENFRGKKHNIENYKGRIPWNKGKRGYKIKPSSEEKKRKISEANKGRISHKKGIPLSEETKRKISFSHLGRHWYVGEDGKRHY